MSTCDLIPTQFDVPPIPGSDMFREWLVRWQRQADASQLKRFKQYIKKGERMGEHQDYMRKYLYDYCPHCRRSLRPGLHSRLGVT